ncbi:MAG: hypothetical protein ACRD0Q_08235 [Acidimicrobiales bacterium]
MNALRHHPLIAGSVAAYVVVLVGFGLATGARLTVPYAVIVVGLALAVAVADERVRFSRTVLVGLALWGLGHLAGGLIQLDGDRILYNAVIARWLHFDNLVHAVGFGTAGVACWEATRSWLPAESGHRLGTVVVVALLGMGVGAFNEVVEFAASHLLAETSIGGYENTGRDLVANLLGSLAGGYLVSVRKPRSDGPGEPVSRRPAAPA